MKISLNWVKEFTNVKLGIDELVAKIGAQLGEVEEVINLGERYRGIVVAKVMSCDKHPGADKLSVCKIDDGGVTKGVTRDEKGLVQVVCGASNVRKGLTVAWIPPGSVVPSTFDSERFMLEARELRGIVSNGMLASGKELAINDDQDGILIIDKPCEPGDTLAKVYQLDDYIIDIENKMFTHRPDCFGILGVAREIAGISGVKFVSPDWYLDVLDKLTRNAKTDELPLKIKNELPELVPRFIAVPMSDVVVNKSPIMVQSFLSRVGIKPINNVVDITNFVMVLTAQPLHAYDYDKLLSMDGSKVATVMIRKPKKGEKISLLNGKTITPREDAIMITTAKRLIGLGGVMGGVDTEVGFDTKNIVLECATFDMYSIRRTAMAHGLFTDAVTRFNKGQSSRAQDKVIAYAVAWMQKLAGAKVAGQLHDIRSDAVKIKPVSLKAEFVNQRLGSSLSDKQIAKMLENVEFLVELKAGKLQITAPYWRTDIDIPEDIVEEIGRLHGYDNLPVNLLKRDIMPTPINSLLDVKLRIRDILSAAGASEVLTYSFVHGKLLAAANQDSQQAYQLSNALSPDLQYYRLSLLPSLLDKVYANIRAGHSEFGLFEINKSHNKTSTHEDGMPIEAERLAFVFAADSNAAKGYHGSAYYQAKHYAQYLLAQFGFKDLIYEPTAQHNPKTDTGQQMLAPFSKARSAHIKTAKGVLLGVVGEVSPTTKQSLKLPGFTAGFELDLQMLEQYSVEPAYSKLLRYPSTNQDISLRLPLATSFAELDIVLNEALMAAAASQGYKYNLSVGDIYQPKGKNTKNILFHLTISHPDRTLVTEEVNLLLADLAAKAKKALGAERL